MATLHVHLDESGNLGFSPRDTRYYVFAVAWTYDPAPLATELTESRFSLLKNGHNIEAFHAAEERKENRNTVVSILSRHENWQFAGIVIEKAKVDPRHYEPHKFYPRFATIPLTVAFSRALRSTTDHVLVFTDALPMKKHRKSVEKAIKITCRKMLPRILRFESFHHHRASNAWIQVADYCSWAVYRKWEHGDDRTYNQLRSYLVTEEIEFFKKEPVK
ncbi:MAG: DUF3800 domain-containing protein [Candidatus Tectomicrobia bacterium]|nr:DUF3800 domain-containing protein [Candidatus Tectomicrobia bacterium]